jgi:thioredoxin-dependent peroxiredoxin
MKLLKTGLKAPAFKLKNHLGLSVALKDFAGEKGVILYFYPKALTPGCTVQACSLRDHLKKIKKLGYEVLGVSGDEEKKLLKFYEKEKLNFPLLSDPAYLTCKKYGAFGKKKFMGKEYEGILRKTFVIDLKGKISLILDPVNTKTHHQDLLDHLPLL